MRHRAPNQTVSTRPFPAQTAFIVTLSSHTNKGLTRPDPRVVVTRSVADAFLHAHQG